MIEEERLTEEERLPTAPGSTARKRGELLMPAEVVEDSKRDRLAAALWLGRHNRFKSLVEHPLFPQVFGRMVAGESILRVTAWAMSAVPVGDPVFGTASFDALSRRLYRFRAALPEHVVFARTYLDEKFGGSIESTLDVISEFDAAIRLQKDRVGRFVEKEKAFPVPLEQVRREIGTLGVLLASRRDTAIVFGMHGPNAVVPNTPLSLTQINVTSTQPTGAGRRLAEMMQERPEIVGSVSALLDELSNVMVVQDDAGPEPE
jgi:hypothetical protein